MKILSCEFNIDTACVELNLADGTTIYNMYQRSEPGRLIYNNLAAYADLILDGDLERCLKAVTVNKQFEN